MHKNTRYIYSLSSHSFSFVGRVTSVVFWQLQYYNKGIHAFQESILSDVEMLQMISLPMPSIPDNLHLHSSCFHDFDVLFFSQDDRVANSVPFIRYSCLYAMFAQKGNLTLVDPCLT